MGEEKRKQRAKFIYGTTTSAEIKSIEVMCDPSKEQFSFGNGVTDFYSEMSYERVKGPKILSRVPMANDQLHWREHEALRQNYEFVVAVDTNTISIDGKRISVTGVTIATHSAANFSIELGEFWEFDVPFCFALTGVKEKPENFGWAYSLEQLVARKLITPATKVGMIVDSDLGNIPAYNARKKEFISGNLLPPSVQLIYASSDVGMESIANKALKTADSVSSQIISALRAGAISLGPTEENPWYESARIILVNKRLDTRL
ncbi:MAG: hypothetical protein BGP04_16540 [Rhizobiales bacterium 62-17]|nr:hypothetical protein [Hyphomicrobiales bacterium]OJY03350.1 MAG: hypothetical protein BGP04_16540 [Rhizobiales bacterium 62-17]